MGELKVKLCDRVIFNKSGNQGNQWNMHQLHLQGTGSKEVRTRLNRPFPSSRVPLFQNETKCETFHMKMSSACSFIFMQIKVIFIRKVSHLASL